MKVKKGSTNVSVYFKIPALLTSTDFDTQYTRDQTAPTAKIDVTALAATDTAHTDNKGIYVDGTTSPGNFRLDVPDDAFATGVNYVYCTLLYAEGLQETVRVQLVNYNVEDVYDLIGTAGAALTDLGGMSTGMKAEIEAECDDAITANASIIAMLEDTATTLPGLINALNNITVADILATAQTYSVGAKGATRTVNQLLYELHALLSNKSVLLEILTTYALNGTSAAKTYDLDDATNPTEIIEAT